MRAVVVSLLSHFPLLKSTLRRLRDCLFALRGTSSRYVALNGEKANTEAVRLRNSWQSEALPQRQRVLVEQQLDHYKAGGRIDVFDVFVEALRALPNLCPKASLLEVGCSSGYYSEVIELAKLPIQYVGCDYSSAFIRMAREKYPAVDFAVEDAVALRYANASFDVVVSGCCLLHIPEYSKAVAEAVRVARRYVIFHRTPVVWGQPERWYRKKAYGIETVEIHFNETEFLELLSTSGLELIAVHDLGEEPTDDTGRQGQAIRTYLCKKKE
jgi:SAM-dependent methyltransferase